MMHKEKKITLETFMTASEDSFGNITSIARKLNVPRSTLYDFIAANPEAKKRIESLREEFDDLAEHAIQQEILDGNQNMLRFYASTKLRGRGYAKTLRVEDSKQEKPEFNIFLKIQEEK